LQNFQHSYNLKCMSATIRINPEKSLVEVEIDGVSFEPEDFPETCDECGFPGGFKLVVDSESGIGYIAMIEEVGGMAAGTVYRLSPIHTKLEEGVDLESDDEEDDGEILVEHAE
jgi:hypothetical protein